MSNQQTQIDELKNSIAILEAQRATLGDAVVDAALGPMREKLAALEATHAPTSDAAEGERKLVTILFADISGFTALSETIDAELVTEIVNTCFEALTRVVHKYGGTVDKYIGDAIMALFGAPDAHEDDPERAIHTAIEMHAALRNALAGLPPFASDLQLHIGVDTGFVVAGAVGASGQRAYTVMGDAVNRASRLMSVAPNGHIYIGPDTYQRTSRLFEFKTLAPMRLKGKREPLAVYEVIAPIASPATMRGLEGLRSPLVGREHEFAALRQKLDALLDGAGSIVAIVGEAGLGKSRLIAELHSSLHDEHHRAGRELLQVENQSLLWLEGRCTSFSQSASYSLIVQVLRNYFGIADAPAHGEAILRVTDALTAILPDQVDEVLPYLCTLLGLPVSGDRIRYLDAEALQKQVFFSVRRLFDALSIQTPVALILDDLHWIDDTSLALIEYLLPLFEQRPMMMVWAYRPRRKQEGIQPLVDKVASEHAARYQSIELQPLPRDLGDVMVQHLLARSDLPASAQHAILERAEGNPFYIEEVIRTLIESQILIQSGEHWSVDGGIPDLDQRIRAALPTTLIGLLTARIDRLPEAHKRVLGVASVIGRTFSRRLMNAIFLDPALIGETLQLLEREGLIETSEAPWGLTYSFRHVLMWEAAYGMLLKRRRAQLHGEIGYALEQTHREELDEYAPLLAYHFDRSDEDRKANFYLLKAGHAALKVYANREATNFFARAVDRLREAGQDDDQLADALAWSGDARTAAGEVNAAIGLWQEALVMHRRLGRDPDSVAALYRRLGNAWFARGNPARAIENYQHGVEALADQPASATLAQLYDELGRLYFRTGDNNAARDWAGKALALAETVKHAETASLALNTLGIARAREGEVEGAIGDVERSLALALDNDLPVAACRAYTNLGMLYGTVDHSRAVDLCQEGLELARKIGNLSYQSWLHSSLASTYCSLVGNWEHGVAAARASIDLDLQMGHRAHLAVPVILLAQIYQCHGLLDESLRSYEEALALAEENGEPQMLFPCYDGLGTLYLELGDEEKAEMYLDKAQQVVRDAGYSSDSLFVLPFLT
jgi:class 3 adenylate cyclase/tetratricopeptide (TPR) repeat protein